MPSSSNPLGPVGTRMRSTSLAPWNVSGARWCFLHVFRAAKSLMMTPSNTDTLSHIWIDLEDSRCWTTWPIFLGLFLHNIHWKKKHLWNLWSNLFRGIAGSCFFLEGMFTKRYICDIVVIVFQEMSEFHFNHDENCGDWPSGFHGFSALSHGRKVKFYVSGWPSIGCTYILKPFNFPMENGRRW